MFSVSFRLPSEHCHVKYEIWTAHTNIHSMEFIRFDKMVSPASSWTLVSAYVCFTYDGSANRLTHTSTWCHNISSMRYRNVRLYRPYIWFSEWASRVSYLLVFNRAGCQHALIFVPNSYFWSMLLHTKLTHITAKYFSFVLLVDGIHYGFDLLFANLNFKWFQIKYSIWISMNFYAPILLYTVDLPSNIFDDEISIKSILIRM